MTQVKKKWQNEQNQYKNNILELQQLMHKFTFMYVRVISLGIISVIAKWFPSGRHSSW